MASIQTTIELNDKMSAKLQRISAAATQAQSSLRGVQTATGTLDSTSAAANAASSALSDIDFPNNSLNGSITSTSDEVGSLITRFNGLRNIIGAFTGVYISVQGLQRMVDLTDQVTSAQQRMSLIVGSSAKAVQAQQAIMQSANDSYSDYIDMSNQVAKLMMNAPNTFNSVGAAADFVNTFNKLGTLGGTSVYESSQAMYQLTQSMAKGKLDGDELRSVMEGVPLVAKTIADSLGVDVGTMKAMAAEGQVTAKVVKDALSNAMGDVNKQFDKAYGKTKTFAMIWTVFKNNAINAVQPIMDALSGLWNSEGAENFGNQTLSVLNSVSTGIATVIGWVSKAGTLVAQNWNTVSTVLKFSLGMIGAHIVRLGATAVVEGAANTVTAARAKLLRDVSILTGRATSTARQHASAESSETATTGAHAAAENTLSGAMRSTTAQASALSASEQTLASSRATDTAQSSVLATSESTLATARGTNTTQMAAETAQETQLIALKQAEAAASTQTATAATAAAATKVTASQQAATAATAAGAATTAASSTAASGISMVAARLGMIIGIVMMVVNAIYVFGGAWARETGRAETDLGNLFGVIASVGAGAVNIAKFVANAFVQSARNVKAAFVGAIQGVIQKFNELRSTAMKVVITIANALNKLPFVNIDTSGLVAKADQYSAKAYAAEKAKNASWDKIKTYDSISGFIKSGDGVFKYSNISDTYKKYAKKGDAFAKGKTAQPTDPVNPYSLGNTYSGGNSGTPQDLKKVKGDTGKIAKNTEISSQQLAYLHDIAHRDAVNKYTTAEIKVNMTNNNKIDNTMNLEDIVNNLVVGVKGAQYRLAEGV